MKRFVISGAVPGAGRVTEEQLAEIAKTSNAAAASLGVPYKNWVTTYVTGDKMYCVHETQDEDAVGSTLAEADFRATWRLWWPVSSGRKLRSWSRTDRDTHRNNATKSRGGRTRQGMACAPALQHVRRAALPADP